MNSLQKILMYVEPWVELSEDFRLGAYGHYNYIKNELKKVNEYLDIKILISDNLYHEIKNRKPEWLTDDDSIIIVKLNDLERVYPDYKEAASRNYHNNHTSENNNKLYKIFRKSLGNWVPEMIIMHETHAPFFYALYPDALILHGMYGMTFKEPYPQTYLFDCKGLYSNSIFNSEDVLKNIQISDKEKQTIYNIKNWYAQQIVPHDPTWGIIEKYQAKYDKLILVPLQVNNYYAFDECSKYKDQLEFLEDALKHIPKTWGVIVTGHSSYEPMVDDRKFMQLKLQYENLIQLPELDDIPFVSQALLPHVDALVSISSSLALQSLIFNKPLVLAGNSHINKVATCTLENISEVFDKKYDEEINFKILKFFFLKYHLLSKSKMEDFYSFSNYLNDYYQNFLSQRLEKYKSSILPDLYGSLEEYFQDLIHTSQWRQWVKTLSGRRISVDCNPIFANILFNDHISWDLFDTLVDRPFINPHELFQAVEDIAKHETNNVYFPFHMLRRESERLARIQFTHHRREVKFNEIYQCLSQKTCLDEKHIDTLRNLELNTERSCIKPRRLMQRTWEFAGRLGKVRSIITDIYLDEEFIQEIVYQNGYGDYDQLFVSSEERVRKEDGSIFPEYISKINNLFGPGKFLHIGDNPRADGEMAKKYGINAYVIPKSIDQLRKSYYAKLFDKPLARNSYDNSIIIGMIANRFFSSPKTHFDHNTIGNHDLYNLGYSIMGPFLISYVQWVIRKLKSHKVNRVYFLARDGYLIMKVYEIFRRIFKDLPEYRYLLCSRRGVAVPGIFDIDNILETAMLNYGITTIGNFLNTRFGLDMDDIPEKILKKYSFKKDGSTKISFPDDISITNNFVSDIQDIIIKNAQEERRLYDSYLREEGLYDDINISLVDIGYSGTMQRKIKSITQKSYIGLYMLTHNYVLPNFRNEVFEGWLEEYDNQRSPIRNTFNDHIPLLESMLSSDAGSFLNFSLDEAGQRQVNYLYSEEEDYRCFFVRTVQKGVIDFAEDFISRFNKLSLDIELSPSVGSNLMFRFGSDPSVDDVNLFEGLLLENMFAGSEFSIIANAQKYLNSDKKMTKDNYNYLLGKSKWKQGAIVAYQKYLDTPHSAVVNAKANHVNNSEPIATTGDSSIKQRSLTKDERLVRKLEENPKLFIEDSKFIPRFIKKIIISNSISLNLSKKIIKRIIG